MDIVWWGFLPAKRDCADSCSSVPHEELGNCRLPAAVVWRSFAHEIKLELAGQMCQCDAHVFAASRFSCMRVWWGGGGGAYTHASMNCGRPCLWVISWMSMRKPCAAKERVSRDEGMVLCDIGRARAPSTETGARLGRQYPGRPAEGRKRVSRVVDSR